MDYRRNEGIGRKRPQPSAIKLIPGFFKGPVSVSVCTALLPPILSLPTDRNRGVGPAHYPFPSPPSAFLSVLWGLGLVLGCKIRQWEASPPLALFKTGCPLTLPYAHGLVSVPWLLGVSGHRCKNGITFLYIHIYPQPCPLRLGYWI